MFASFHLRLDRCSSIGCTVISQNGYSLSGQFDLPDDMDHITGALSASRIDSSTTIPAAWLKTVVYCESIAEKSSCVSGRTRRP